MPLISSRRRTSVPIVLAAVLIYLSVGGFYVQCGQPNVDEGNYAYATYAVMHGQIPYRDFAYTQMPLLPYLQGEYMAVAGFGVHQERLLNAFLGTLAIALCAGAWHRSKLHPFACLILILIWSLSLPLIYYSTIGKTYAMPELLLMAASTSLCLNLAPRTKLFSLSFLCVLAVGCRLTVAPAAFVLWCGLVALYRGQLSWTLLLGIPALSALAILGPFFYIDPANALYFNWTLHRLSALPPHRAKILQESFLMVPGAAIIGIAGIVALVSERNALRKPAAWILLAGVINWFLVAAFVGTYAEYTIPTIPMVIAGGGLLFGHIHLSKAKFLLGSFFAASAVAWGVFHEKNTIGKGYFSASDSIVTYIRNHTGPSDVILTSMPGISSEANRAVFPRTELGTFSITVEMDAQAAKSRGLITFDELLSAIDRQSVAFVVLSTSHNLNFSTSIPSTENIKPEFYSRFSNLLIKRYDCIAINKYFLLFKIRDPKNKSIMIYPQRI